MCKVSHAAHASADTKEGHYDSEGAFGSPESPYSSWYQFSEDRTRYESWWGFPTLPNVDETDPNYLEFICGKDGVLAHWMKAGVRGWRLDVADELPDTFLETLRRRVKAENRDAYIVGEVWEDASNKSSYGHRRPYLMGGQLDSVMNYPWRSAVLNFMRDGNADVFYEAVMGILDHYPQPAVRTLMNSLSTHDTVRAITCLGVEPVSYTHLDVYKRQVVYLAVKAIGGGDAVFYPGEHWRIGVEKLFTDFLFNEIHTGLVIIGNRVDDRAIALVLKTVNIEFVDVFGDKISGQVGPSESKCSVQKLSLIHILNSV